ncbi:hypothetical protein PRIPAC_96775, partial [Pristionchus pacificus]
FNLFSAFMRDPFSEKWKISEEMKGVEPSERRNRPTSKEKGYKNWRPELVQSSEILTIDPDLIWQKFGTFGRYQFINLVMVSAPSLIYSALMMVMPFLSEEQHSFTCELNEGFQAQYQVLDKCTISELKSGKSRSCIELIGSVTRFDYTGNSKDNTLTNEFDLVCEQSDWREHGSSSFLFGAMFGATILSYLSDRLGRRKSFLLSITISTVVNCATALSPNYLIFLALRFIAGFGLGGNLNIGYVMMSEVVAPKTREYTPFIGAFFWVFGYMFAGVARMYIKNWRWVYFTCTFPGVMAVMVYFKYFPESLHWQVSNKQKEEITLHIQRATRINKMQINVQECLNENNNADANQSNMQHESSKSLYMLIFRTPKLLYHFLLCSFLMVVMNLTYWALSLFSTELSEHKMTGFFLSGIIEFPSAILAVILLKKMKRRPISCMMFVLTAFSLTIAVVLPAYLNESGKRLVTILCPLLAKMFNSIVWSVLPLAMSEMIPTVIRNTFSGGVCFLGDAGSVVAPYLEYLNQFGANTASILIAILTGICALGVMTMPETKGVHLSSGMETFDEGPFLRSIRRTFSRKLDSEDSISKEEQSPMIATSDSISAPVTNDDVNENDDTRPSFFH